MTGSSSTARPPSSTCRPADPDTVDRAVDSAASGDRPALVRFLICTGPVTTNDTAAACAFAAGNFGTTGSRPVLPVSAARNNARYVADASADRTQCWPTSG